MIVLVDQFEFFQQTMKDYSQRAEAGTYIEDDVASETGSEKLSRIRQELNEGYKRIVDQQEARIEQRDQEALLRSQTQPQYDEFGKPKGSDKPRTEALFTEPPKKTVSIGSVTGRLTHPEHNLSTLNSSQTWPRKEDENRASHELYHPTTPYYRPTEHEPMIDLTPKFEAKPMNALQRQQHFMRLMGNKKYDASTGERAVKLTEFMNMINKYKSLSGAPDLEILQSVSTLMAGKAFKWWQSNENSTRTLAEFEIKLRQRFDSSELDDMALLAQFSMRKQKDGEEILDYMDDMRERAIRLHPPLPEAKVIRTIVDNLNREYRGLVASKSYESIETLNRHMEYLGRGHQEKERVVPKRTYPYRSASVKATEIGSDDELAEEDEESDRELDMVDVMVQALQSVRTSKQFKSKGAYKSNTDRRSKRRVDNKVEAEIDDAKVNFCCFGCGAPGVYKRDCPKCQQSDQPSKNERAGSLSTK